MATLLELAQRRREQEERTRRAIGNTLTEETGRGLGSSLSKASEQIGEHRGNYLKLLLNEGQLQPESLTGYQRRLLGSKWLNRFDTPPQPGESNGGFLSDLFGTPGTILENAAGELVEMGKGLPFGLYKTGAAVASDIGSLAQNPLNLGANITGTSGLSSEGDQSQVLNEIIKPTLQAYREKYTQGSPGEILHRAIVEEPLGTALDVGTLATGGAAAAGKTGSIATRAAGALDRYAGEGSRLEQFSGKLNDAGRYLRGFGWKGTRGTRDPLITSTGREISREFGASPLVRVGQRFSDKYLQDIPVIGGRLSTIREKMAEYGGINTRIGRQRILGGFLAANEAKDVIQAAKKLSEKESIAVFMLKNGINPQTVRNVGGVTRGRVDAIQAYKEMLDLSLEGKLPPGYNAQQFVKQGVDEKYMQDLRKLFDDEEFQDMLYHPENYPKMIELSDVWDEQVTKNLEAHDLDIEAHQARIWEPQQALRLKPDELRERETLAGIEAIKDPAGAFERFSARRKAETGQDFAIRPNYIPHEIAEGTYKGNLTKIKRSPAIDKVMRAENIASKHQPSYLKDSDLQLFVSGAMRVGHEAMVRQIHKRERALAHNGAIFELVHQLAMHDKAGELVTAKDEAELAAKLPPGKSAKDYVIVPVDGMMRFYRNEVTIEKLLNDVVNQVKKDHPGEVSDRMEGIVDSLKEAMGDAAKATAMELTSASKPKGVVFSRPAAQHLERSLASLDPAARKGLEYYDRVMAGWRFMTLGAMPRWWVNTFIGSAFMAVLSGAAFRPRNWQMASRYGGKGFKKAGPRYEASMHLMESAPDLRPGLVGAERREADYEGLHLGKVTDWPFGKVENMEGFFKRVGFFHQLDKQAKAHMRQMDEVLDGYQKVGAFSDEYISNILENHPDMVEFAVQDVNKFFYNFTQLGPVERRWVRRFIPFYGWYKFITKLMWQLPAQYPGRTNVLQKLSEIGNEFTEEELGILPPELQGAIFLNADRGNLKYIPTFGLNPFSDFANPAAPEGTVSGLLSTQQLAPLLGATLQSLGLDPYSGTTIELSPFSELIEGKYGNKIDPETGEEIPGGGFNLNTFIGTLMRSMPQGRLLETLANEGRYSSPESIPIFDERPYPMEAGEAYDSYGGELPFILGSVAGLVPRTENLRDYQKQLAEDIKYGKGRRKEARKELHELGIR